MPNSFNRNIGRNADRFSVGSFGLPVTIAVFHHEGAWA